MNTNEPTQNVRRAVWPGQPAALRRLTIITLILLPLSLAVFALLVGDWRLNIGDGTQGEEETWRHLREWLFILTGAIGLSFLLSLLAFFQWLTRFGGWLFSGRRLRWQLITLAWLVTAAGLFFAEEDWRGAHEWNEYRHQLEASGAQLDFTAYIPKPIPDAENFAATPTVKGWFPRSFIFTNDDYAAVASHINTPTALEGQYHLTDLVAWGRAFDQLSSGQTNLADQMASEKTDLAARAAAAKSVLAGLKSDAAILSEFARASQRPQAVYPVVYDLGDLWGVYLPHLANLKQTIVRLKLRACAELAAGRSGEALADTKLALYLADTVKDEPFVISYLVRIAAIQLAIQPVWEGLAEHAWSEAQLQDLEGCLQKYDFIADLQHPFDAERAADVLSSALIKKKGLGYLIEIVGPGQPTSMDIKVANWAGGFIPSGWYDLELLNFCRLYDSAKSGAFDVAQRRVFPDQIDSSAEMFNQSVGGNGSVAWAFLHHQALARAVMWPFNKIVLRTAGAQTMVNQAAIACALERCRLATGQYPQTLAALVPAYLAQLPLDVLTGESYAYRPGADNQFELAAADWTPKGYFTAPTASFLNDYKPNWVWNSDVK